MHVGTTVDCRDAYQTFDDAKRQTREREESRNHETKVRKEGQEDIITECLIRLIIHQEERPRQYRKRERERVRVAHKVQLNMIRYGTMLYDAGL